MIPALFSALSALSALSAGAPCIRVARAGTELRSDTRICPGRYRIADPGGKGVLVVAPGLAFDRGCNRLGRGGGYYDRFLRESRRDPSLGLMAIGVCFAEQIVERVPCDQADQPVDALVTDTEIIR